MKAGILLSGGLDSTVALIMALHKNISIREAFFFDYGQLAADAEHYCASKTCERFGIGLTTLPCNVFPPSALTHSACPNPEIPLRNIVLIAAAASHCKDQGYDALITGCIYEGEKYGYSDNRREMLEPLASILKQNGIELSNILHGSTKAGLFDYAARSGELEWVRKFTHSSYSADRSTSYAWGKGPEKLDKPCQVRRNAYEEYVHECNNK